MTARPLPALVAVLLLASAAVAQEAPPAPAPEPAAVTPEPATVAPAAPVAPAAEAPAPKGRQRWAGPRLGIRHIGTVDLIGAYNPLGVQVSGSVIERWVYDVDKERNVEWSYLQGGIGATVSPAYAQVQAHIEWMPAAVFTLRLDTTVFGYFGTLGALRQFDERPTRWDVDRKSGLPGRDRNGVAYRVMLQPVLQFQVWKVIFRNPLNVSLYGFGGKGRYFYEYENDTLMGPTELLLYNQTWLLFEAWKGKKDAMFLIGALYDVTYAVSTKVRRQRVGGLFMIQPKDPVGAFDRLRVYGMAGYIIEDEVRKGEPFIAAGIGSDFDF